MTMKKTAIITASVIVPIIFFGIFIGTPIAYSSLLDVETPLVTVYNPTDLEYKNYGFDTKKLDDDSVLVSGYDVEATINNSLQPQSYPVYLSSDGQTGGVYVDSSKSTMLLGIDNVQFINDDTIQTQDELLDSQFDSGEESENTLIFNESTGQGIIVDHANNVVLASVSVRGVVYQYNATTGDEEFVYGNPAGNVADNFGFEMAIIDSNSFVSCAPKYSENQNPKYGACYIFNTLSASSTIIKNPDSSLFPITTFGRIADATVNWIAISAESGNGIAFYDIFGNHIRTITTLADDSVNLSVDAMNFRDSDILEVASNGMIFSYDVSTDAKIGEFATPAPMYKDAMDSSEYYTVLGYGNTIEVFDKSGVSLIIFTSPVASTSFGRVLNINENLILTGDDSHSVSGKPYTGIGYLYSVHLDQPLVTYQRDLPYEYDLMGTDVVIIGNVAVLTAEGLYDYDRSKSMGGWLSYDITNYLPITITEIINASGDGAGNTLDYPQGIAIDSLDNVYVTAFDGDNVFKITPAGIITEIINGTGDGVNDLNGPDGITVDSLGNVYVTGYYSDNAFKISAPVDCSTGGTACTITEIIDVTGDGLGNDLKRPWNIAVDSNNVNVYVGGEFSHNVFKISAPDTCSTGGTPCIITEIIDGDGDGLGNKLQDISVVAVDSKDNVYVGGWDTHNVFKITPANVITEIINDTGDGSNVLHRVWGIAIDSLDNVYVSAFGSSVIDVSNHSGNVFKISAPDTCSTGGTICTITEIIDSEGIVLNIQNDITKEATAIHTPVALVDPTAILHDRLDHPRAVAIDSLDNVYVSARYSDNVFKIFAPDTCSTGGTACTMTEIITSSGDGDTGLLDSPWKIAFDTDDNVYVVGGDSDNVFKILASSLLQADSAPVPVISRNNALTDFPLDDTVIEWTATDLLQKTTGNQTITIIDTIDPVLTIPDDIAFESAVPLDLDESNYGNAGATDIFEPVTITDDAPATFPLGETIITWTSTDANGNTSTDTQTITINPIPLIWNSDGFIPINGITIPDKTISDIVSIDGSIGGGWVNSGTPMQATYTEINGLHYLYMIGDANVKTKHIEFALTDTVDGLLIQPIDARYGTNLDFTLNKGVAQIVETSSGTGYGMYDITIYWKTTPDINGFIPIEGVTIPDKTISDIVNISGSIGGGWVNSGTPMQASYTEINGSHYLYWLGDANVKTKHIEFVLTDTVNGLFIKPDKARYGTEPVFTDNEGVAQLVESSTDAGFGMYDVSIYWK